MPRRKTIARVKPNTIDNIVRAVDMQRFRILLFYVGQSLLRITRKSVRISVILVCTVYAASLFTLAPLRLMPEAQDSYSESSYSSAESLEIESEK